MRAKTNRADMAVNPRAAARGCIESVISFTKTKVPPHVPEMITIRLTHSAESDTFLAPNTNQRFICLLGRVIKGGFVTTEKSGARRLGPA
jgi:hypothetical protein